MNVLANDGISESGKVSLQRSGFNVVTDHVEQDKLKDYINDNNIKVLLVRSATQVRKDIIDSCPALKIIGRGGVGMDNIDVSYATSKGIKVINTPAASSISVAELVFAHLFSLVRFLHDSNRNMPLEGDRNFRKLKQNYAGRGRELKGKTIGVVGAGKIGVEVVKIALGLGMHVLVCDTFVSKVVFDFEFFDGRKVPFELGTVEMDKVLSQSDFVTLHIPAQDKPTIGDQQFRMMKKGAGVINASRGGALDEVALVDSINKGHISYAGLDVFENEPNPEIQLLMNPNLSLSPHIGASTIEAQERVGRELAKKVIEILK